MFIIQINPGFIFMTFISWNFCLSMSVLLR